MQYISYVFQFLTEIDKTTWVSGKLDFSLSNGNIKNESKIPANYRD